MLQINTNTQNKVDVAADSETTQRILNKLEVYKQDSNIQEPDNVLLKQLHQDYYADMNFNEFKQQADYSNYLATEKSIQGEKRTSLIGQIRSEMNLDRSRNQKGFADASVQNEISLEDYDPFSRLQQLRQNAVDEGRGIEGMAAYGAATDEEYNMLANAREAENKSNTGFSGAMKGISSVMSGINGFLGANLPLGLLLAPGAMLGTALASNTIQKFANENSSFVNSNLNHGSVNTNGTFTGFDSEIN